MGKIANLMRNSDNVLFQTHYNNEYGAYLEIEKEIIGLMEREVIPNKTHDIRSASWDECVERTKENLARVGEYGREWIKKD